MVPDVDRYWALAQTLDARVLAPIADRDYGLRDFTILDPTASASASGPAFLTVTPSPSTPQGDLRRSTPSTFDPHDERSPPMVASTERLVRAARLSEVQEEGCLVVHVEGHTLALFARGDEVHAVDNRCPHMGFPLDRGTVKDGILTCHWHHARFDLACGGTFDPWADDVRAFPVEIRDGEVWVDIAPRQRPAAHQRERLRDGLERDIPLVLAKAVIGAPRRR